MAGTWRSSPQPICDAVASEGGKSWTCKLESDKIDAGFRNCDVRGNEAVKARLCIRKTATPASEAIHHCNSSPSHNNHCAVIRKA